jgi:peptidoglycan-N-acetylglucosamine deacetylase
MFLVARPPYLLRKLYPKCIWRMPSSENKIYLTFDDGPVPEVTPWVLDVLDRHGIKATFFCVGENVKKYPDLYKEIVRRGHTTANHTFNHIKGLSTSNEDYFQNVERCREEVSSDLFRPPYGQIKPSQQNFLSKNYRIIMWDVLSYDYSSAISPEKCLENVMRNTRRGSIIVFHDSLKAMPNLEFALPKALEGLKEKSYEFALFRF